MPASSSKSALDDTSKTFIQSNGQMIQELKNSTMINSQAIQKVKNATMVNSQSIHEIKDATMVNTQAIAKMESEIGQIATHLGERERGSS